MVESVVSPEILTYAILPILIFFAFICDVSHSTLRVIFISEGIRYLAPIIGFLKSLSGFSPLAKS
jgi:uncharacterized protein YebE (UPF0316 family)